MYRICFAGAEPFGHQCETLEQARAIVRATVGDFHELPGDDDMFWLCCRNFDASGSEVVARIYRDVDPVQESLAGPASSHSGERECVPESGELSTMAELPVRSRRTPTG